MSLGGFSSGSFSIGLGGFSGDFVWTGGVNWQLPKARRRFSREEMLALITEQRIQLGILQPDLPGQDVPTAQAIAEEVTEAMMNRIKMAELPIDESYIYDLALYEARYAIEHYKGAKALRRRKIAAATMLFH